MCLEQYFRTHRYIWYARVFLMTGLAIMLAIGILPSGFEFISNSKPIACAWEMGTYQLDVLNGPYMIMSEIILIGGLAVRVVQMFSTTRRLCSSFFETIRLLWRAVLVWRCRKLQELHRFVQAVFLPSVIFALAFSVSMQCLVGFLCSRLFGVGDHDIEIFLRGLTKTVVVVIIVIDMGESSTFLTPRIVSRWRKYLELWAAGASLVAFGSCSADGRGVLWWDSTINWLLCLLLIARCKDSS